MGPLYESQISERCQWEALNAVITAATQSPLMGSGWDCTWNCVCMYASLIACVCVNVNILCACLQMEDHCGCGLDDKKQSSYKKNLTFLFIFLSFRTNSFSHMHAPDVSPA